MMLIITERVETIVGKGEIACNQHFLFFPHGLKKKKNSFS